jgi:probable HAF family extracellular repeat protein
MSCLPLGNRNRISVHQLVERRNGSQRLRRLPLPASPVCTESPPCSCFKGKTHIHTRPIVCILLQRFQHQHRDSITMRMGTIRGFAPLLVGGAFVALCGIAHAGIYTYTDFGTLGGTASIPTAINNAGQVVGMSRTTGDAAEYSVIWNGAVPTILNTLGGAGSEVYAINDAGQVAGWSHTTAGASQGGIYHASIWNGVTATDLSPLSAAASVAYAINNAGKVAGWTNASNFYSGEFKPYATVWNGTTVTALATTHGAISGANAINDVGQVAGWEQNTNSGITHAILWNGGIATDLGTLGGAVSSALAINNAGQVVGYSFATGNVNMYATLWNGTIATILDTLGGTYSGASDINNAGQVVGYSQTFSGIYHATLWNGTTVTDLNSFLDASVINSGWVLNDARGINDHGWIVGTAYNSHLRETHAYLLSISSVPEPATYVTLLSGLSLIALMSRRRKSYS